MNQPLLVIDVSYMCHRAFHTMGKLSHKGTGTGVIFGFLKSISALKDEFQTDHIAFCFEHPHLLRRDIYPAYKKKRHTDRTPEEIESYRELGRQIKALRTEHLPAIGFKNVFCVDGYESDDLMASIAQSFDGEVILVTADSDLLQCLSDAVSVYSPASQMLHTEKAFIAKHRIAPFQWAKVKAIAGCASDEIVGIKGVGEIGAIKFIRGELPERTMQYQAIFAAENKARVRLNRQLVQLPFEGCPRLRIQEDAIDPKGWKEVCAKLGMRTLAGRPPIASRKLVLGV